MNLEFEADQPNDDGGREEAKQEVKLETFHIQSENPSTNDDELDDFQLEGAMFNCARLLKIVAGCKWLSCISLLFYLLVAGICLGMLENHLKAMENLFSDSLTLSLNNFPRNVKSLPIMDIELKNLTQNCSKGYEEVVLGVWKGTKPGCYNSSGAFPTLLEGACPSDCMDCAAVPAVSEHNITTWKRKKFCISRAKTALYTLDCPPGYKKCGRDTCINEPICPLTYLSYVSDHTVNADDFIQIGDGYLAIARGTDKAALINIKISVGAPFSCFDGRSLPARKSSEDYKLALQKNTGCGEFGFDLQTYEIMDTRETDLYQTQNWSNLISNLPLFTETLQEEKAYLLAERKYEMGQNESCYSVAIEELPLLKNKNRANASVLRLFCAVEWVLMGVFVILMIFNAMFRWRRACLKKFRYVFHQNLRDGSGVGLLFIHFWLWTSTFVVIAFIAVVQPNFRTFHDVTQGIRKALHDDCFSSDSLNIFFKRFNELIHGTYSPVEILLSLVLYGCLSANICYFITGILLCMEYKYTKSDS